MLGEKKVFTESNPLVDAAPFRLTLTEDASDSKYLIAKGEFGKADAPTQNRRIYSRKLWEREIKKVSEAIKSGRVLGHLDHPSSGKSSLSQISHIMTKLEMLPDGRIVGEAKVLKNQHGQQLKSILEAGGAVGVSSRGLGSTVQNNEGYDVVQEDFSYITHDFVIDPAVPTSYPQFMEEGTETTSDKKLEETIPPVAVSAPEATEQERETVMEEKTAVVETTKEPKTEAITEAKVREIVATEMKGLFDSFKSDIVTKLQEATAAKAAEAKEVTESTDVAPTVGVTIEETKVDAPATAAPVTAPVAETAAPATETEQKLAEAVALAESLTMKLELQTALAESKHPEIVKDIVGDLAQYKKVERLQEALDRAQRQVDRKVREEKTRRAEREKLIETFEKDIAKLKEENKQLREGLEESTKIAKEYALKVYVEDKVRMNPNGDKIRKLCEGKATQKDCDAIIENFSIASTDAEDYNSIRRRFAKVPTALVEDHVKATGGSAEPKREVVEGVDKELEQLLPGQLGEMKSLAEAVSVR